MKLRDWLKRIIQYWEVLAVSGVSYIGP